MCARAFPVWSETWSLPAWPRFVFLLQLLFIAAALACTAFAAGAAYVLTGTINDTGFLEKRNYRLADGRIVPSQVFRIKSLKVGSKVLENVTGSVAPAASTLLLGQTFLSRFKSWSIDNSTQELILER